MFTKEKETIRNLKPGAEGKVEWSSPSNIALVKYWGKRENQLPENPNLSITLSESRTITRVEYSVTGNKEIEWEFMFDGSPARDFEPKLALFFERVNPYLPYLNNLKLKISSRNTFPHSTGIASSASAMSALALCILDIAYQIESNHKVSEEFRKKASFISRLGSGSAARSVFPGFSVWGSSEQIENSSDDFATGLHIKEKSFFKGIQDAIIIVSGEKKKVSSTLGHGLMKTNPYATLRYQHARENLEQLIKAINSEDLDEFIRITENEALTLHGLMMSSQPGYILLKKGSIEIIDKIREFRETTGAFLTFTLDAGPNVHLLYHQRDHKLIDEFLREEIIAYADKGKIIQDRIGKGPEKTFFNNVKKGKDL